MVKDAAVSCGEPRAPPRRAPAEPPSSDPRPDDPAVAAGAGRSRDRVSQKRQAERSGKNESTINQVVHGFSQKLPYQTVDIDGGTGPAILAPMPDPSAFRDWPADERPRERLYHKGAAALSDAELLAIQLGTGVAGLSALAVAQGLLAEYGALQELVGREVAEIAAVRGVGREIGRASW